MNEEIQVTGEQSLSNSFLGNTKQVCIVTRDIYRTMEGLEPPRVFRRLHSSFFKALSPYKLSIDYSWRHGTTMVPSSDAAED